MTRIALLFLLAAAASSAQEFAAVKTGENVTYPLPPMPLPTAGKADGKWAETEDSPALRVSRAWAKLAEGAGVERSDKTRNLFQAWKNEVTKSGASSRTSQASHAAFLAAYKSDLERARSIYEGVLREVDAMDADGQSSAREGVEPRANNLAREAEEQIRAADRDDRLTSSACFLSPETCQQPDASDKALQDEISGLVKDTLEAGGPDGSLSLYSLKRKAGLLALRARVMAAVTQRAAARLATEVATAQDGKGGPRALPIPTAPLGGAQAVRRTSTPASDPYQ